MKVMKIFASIMRARFAPSEEPAKAQTTQESESFHGMKPLLANLNVASTVPIVELILFVAMALWTGRPESR